MTGVILIFKSSNLVPRASHLPAQASLASLGGKMRYPGNEVAKVASRTHFFDACIIFVSHYYIRQDTRQ